jgi:MFS family permease
MDRPAAVRAWATLGLLGAINLLNYADRYVLAGVLPLVQREFGSTDAELGVLSSSFLLVYALASPFTGVLGDRFPRRWFVGGGAVLWSLATVWSGSAGSFGELLAARSLVGIGEAGYAAIAPGLIADLFAAERRGRILAGFYAAMPVGIALGYAVGGAVGAAYGWRPAFWVAGVPGLVLGILAFAMREPVRGAMDVAAAPAVDPVPAATEGARSENTAAAAAIREVAPGDRARHEGTAGTAARQGDPGIGEASTATAAAVRAATPGDRARLAGAAGTTAPAGDAGIEKAASPAGPVAPPLRTVLRTLVRTRSYLFNAAGTTAMTFAMGGLSAWMPTFLHRVRGVPLDRAGVTFGAALIVAGLAGTVAGGWLGDRLAARHGGGHFLASGGGLLLGTPFAVVAAAAPDPAVYWPAIVVALFLLFFNTGPLNAALVNVIPATMRATAVAVNVLLIHVLGDALSPTVIGRLSDATSLEVAVIANAGAIALSGAILLAGAGSLRRDLAAIAAGRSPAG